jgi:hypothetical protein
MENKFTLTASHLLSILLDQKAKVEDYMNNLWGQLQGGRQTAAGSVSICKSMAELSMQKNILQDTIKEVESAMKEKTPEDIRAQFWVIQQNLTERWANSIHHRERKALATTIGLLIKCDQFKDRRSEELINMEFVVKSIPNL